MEVGGLTETVEVTGASPVVDTQTTTRGANLDSRDAGAASCRPLTGGHLYVAPGVTSGGGTAIRIRRLAAAAASRISTSLMASTSRASGSGRSVHMLAAATRRFGRWQRRHLRLHQRGAGEDGGLRGRIWAVNGGVVNVITKSGTNEVHGTLFGYTRPKELESSYKQIHTANGWVNTTGTTQSDFGAEVGGPVAKNRLFYFAAIDPQWDKKWAIAPDNTLSNGAFAFPLRSEGDLARTRRFLSYSAKGTYEASNNHRFTASFFGDPGHGPSGPQRNTALLGDESRFSELDKFGGHNQAVKYDGVLTNAFLLEASFARATTEVTEVPSIDTWSVLDTRVTPQVRTGGIGSFSNNRGTNKQYQAKATNVFGGHQLKYGGRL
jgi:hypothetical protein